MIVIYKKLTLLSTAHCSPIQELCNSNTAGTHNIMGDAAYLFPQKNDRVTTLIRPRPLPSSSVVRYELASPQYFTLGTCLASVVTYRYVTSWLIFEKLCVFC
jgi:hypothetical protein